MLGKTKKEDKTESRNEDLADDLFMTEEPTLLTLTDKDKVIRGEFLGFTLSPWPIVLIDDGGAIFGITMNYKIEEFLRKTAIPTGCVLKIEWTGCTDIGSGRSVNHYRFEVTNLPESYDKKRLQEFSGKRLDPSNCDPNIWDKIEAARDSSRKAEEDGGDHKDDLPF